MAHNNHIVDGVNLDVGPLYSLEDAKKEYLELASDWEDPYGPPIIKEQCTKHCTVTDRHKRPSQLDQFEPGWHKFPSRLLSNN